MADTPEHVPAGSLASRRSFLGASAAATGLVAAGRWLCVEAAQAAERHSDDHQIATLAAHPLDPLTAGEIERAVAALRQQKSIGESCRFVSVTLAEPSRPDTVASLPQAGLGRIAAVLVMDTAKGQAFEAQVDLTTAQVTKFEPLAPGLQPPIVLEEFAGCEAAVKSSPEFRAALAKRGVSDVDLVYTIRYEDQGRERPILYRASIGEMVVPYGDPGESSYRKNAFDIGEFGIGTMANSLVLGCDCLGTVRYFDVHVCDSRGRPVSLKNAVCLHEEDAGLLWKHTDWRTGQTETRRSRRLVVSFIATVGNYDYGFYWNFYQDGTIQCEVKLTGIVNTTALKPGEQSRFGSEVAPRLMRRSISTFLPPGLTWRSMATPTRWRKSTRSPCPAAPRIRMATPSEPKRRGLRANWLRGARSTALHRASGGF